MVLTNTEHPPAAGAALGLVIHDWSLWSVGVILVSAVALSILRAILRPRLVNLLCARLSLKSAVSRGARHANDDGGSA